MATKWQYDIVTGSNPKSFICRPAVCLWGQAFWKCCANWASGASWTKCHDIQHKWCTYTIVQKWNTTKQTLSSSHRLLLRTLVLHVFVLGKKGWPIADEIIGPVTFGLRHPRTTSSNTIQPVRTFTKGSVSPQVDDTSPAKAIHLGIPGHPWNHLIYVASSWQATACTKSLHQHLLVNFFGEY